MPNTPRAAYFSMEIGVHPDIPTYSGGLGMLAGDCLRSAADIGLPMCAVTLLHRKGYFKQSIDSADQQQEAAVEWDPAKKMTRELRTAAITLRGRRVHIAAWRYDVAPSHPGGQAVPVFFLDTDLADNAPEDRRITDQLYGGDHMNRLVQEAVLGIGGVHMLRELGYKNIPTFHMNEGHAALLTIELLAEHSFARRSSPADPEVVREVKQRCVFTTHTPVPAGHDRFDLEMVASVLGEQSAMYPGAWYCEGGVLNMSRLAFAFSKYSNGVSKRHAEVSRELLGTPRIDAVTNGVHAPTWIGPELASLLDLHCAGWRADFTRLRRAMFIPDEPLRAAHEASKGRLLARIKAAGGVGFSPSVFTIGFARRATGYKRTDLLFAEPARLRQIAERFGGLQIVFAGKAHPQDHMGKDMIRRVIGALRELSPSVRGIYMPNYDFALCRELVSGVDLWLNNPVPPLEASGTSGMKAAMNGVPGLSTPDGWWLESAAEGITGWTIGRDTYGQGLPPPEVSQDAAAIYDMLEREILPLYQRDRAMWTAMMRSCIAINGTHFNTNRVMREYHRAAYAD